MLFFFFFPSYQDKSILLWNVSSWVQLRSMLFSELILMQPWAALARMVSGVLRAGCSPGDDSSWPAAFSSDELPLLPPRGWRDGWMGMSASYRGPSNTSIWPMQKRQDKAGISPRWKDWVVSPSHNPFRLYLVCVTFVTKKYQPTNL